MRAFTPSERFYARAAVCFLGLTCYATFSGVAIAANISFLGGFQRDDQAALFSIDVDSPAVINIRSVGYAGDNVSDVGVIPAGGFDTYLTLFDEGGHFITENDDGQNVRVDPATSQSFDASIVRNLDPGRYFVVLTQYGNYPLGQENRDGFSQTGNPSYTGDPGFALGDPCLGGRFKDSSGGCRTGRYAVEFLNTSGANAYYADLGYAPSAPVFVANPGPGTGAMLLSGAPGSVSLANPEPGTGAMLFITLLGCLCLSLYRCRPTSLCKALSYLRGSVGHDTIHRANSNSPPKFHLEPQTDERSNQSAYCKGR